MIRCDERDQILSDLKREHPGWGRKKLAEATGIPPATVQRWLNDDLNKKHDIPDGYKLKGTSTYYGPNGEIKGQWVKTTEDRERLQEKLSLVIDALKDEVTGLAKATPPPEYTEDDLLVVYPVADAHVGLYAWKEEAGEDWDVSRITEKLNRGMAYLVNSAPPSKVCLVANLADFFHSDTIENKTLRSGHTLDIDTRWAKVFQAGVKSYRNMITMALEKHERVVVKSGIGNHDDHSILSLAMLMQAYFENEPRVEVELPINHFAYFLFGNSLIGINHGEVKPDKLPLIMASDMREHWGQTKYSYWYVGHVHHKTGYEYPGCRVESFGTPGAKDAWSHSKGYRAEKEMQAITIHAEKGEVGRTRINTDWL